MNMLPNLILSCLCSAAIILAGCNKPKAAAAHASEEKAGRQAAYDACGLLTDQEIEAVVGSPIRERKSSGGSDQGLRMSQCFFTAADSSKSVSLAVTQRDPNVKSDRGPNEFWKENFGRYGSGEKEGKGETEQEDEDTRKKKESLREQKKGGEEKEDEGARPPKIINGIGDQAFWSGNRVGGALYVVQKHKEAFVRLSVGGSDNEEKKIEKSKALAQKALSRL